VCYSAQIIGQYRQYLRLFGARMSLHEFVRTFWERRESEGRLKVPKALEEAFLADSTSWLSARSRRAGGSRSCSSR
jgi:hypothetical protein